MQSLATSARARLLPALAAGILTALCYSPVDFWWLGPFTIALLYVLLAGTAPKQAALTGFCFGLGYFGAGVSWVYVSINVYGNAGPILSFLITALFVVVLALFITAQCWVYRRYASRQLAVLSFAATWVLFEWIRGWLFTGFPWLYLGSAHVTTPLAGLAPVFGVFGLSFAVALSGAILGELALRPRWRSPLPWSLAALWLAAFILAHVPWVRPEGEPLRAGIVQGNIAQDLKFRADELENSLAVYERLSAPLWDEHDFLLWPETAIPMAYHNAGEVLDHFARQAGDAALVTGIFYVENGRVHNSIAVEGNGSGLWHKQKLVPFGEYVPLREFVGNVLQFFNLPMSSLAPGPAEQDLLTIKGRQAAAFICYEIVYSDFVRRFGGDADFLITISNDTWFGSSWGPRQHLQIAAMRALELGRSMVRGTNNGVSAIIDARGRVLLQSEQFVEDTISGEVALYSGVTPFSLWGPWPVLLISSLIFLQNFLPIGRMDPARRDRSVPER